MNRKEKILTEIVKLKKEIEKNPTNGSLYKRVGKLTLKTEDKKLYEEAIKSYKKAYKILKNAKLALKIANLYKQNDQFAYAYKYYLKAIKLAPENDKIFLKAKECAFEYYLKDYVKDEHKKDIEKNFLDKKSNSN